MSSTYEPINATERDQRDTFISGLKRHGNAYRFHQVDADQVSTAVGYLVGTFLDDWNDITDTDVRCALVIDVALMQAADDWQALTDYATNIGYRRAAWRGPSSLADYGRCLTWTGAYPDTPPRTAPAMSTPDLY